MTVHCELSPVFLKKAGCPLWTAPHFLYFLTFIVFLKPVEDLKSFLYFFSCFFGTLIEADPMSASAADVAVTFSNYALCIGTLGDLTGAKKYLTMAKKKGCSPRTIDYVCQALKIRI